MKLNYTYQAEVLRVIDGDTLVLLVDLGFNVHTKVKVRLHGVNTPETYGVKKFSEEWKKGIKATIFTRQWVVKHNKKVFITSEDGERLGQGKYGRWLAIVESLNGECLNKLLIEKKHGQETNY